MSSRHYYYPTTSHGRSKLVDRERVFDKEHDRASKYDSSDHSDVPSLSRASTPSSSFSSPPTPTLSPTLPTDSKMGGRHVEFASPVAHSYRRAEWDELSVMRAFASHAGHCQSCDKSLASHRGGLCDRGLGLAKDLGTYFYSYDGKPHSNTDRRRGREKVQVEVPVEYSSVKGLFEALDKGYELKRPSKSKPEVHQSSYAAPEPRLNSRRYTMDSYPTQNRRRFLDHEDYDLRPSRTDSRRNREPVYRTAGGRYVDERPSYHEEYSDRRRPHTPITPLSRYSSGIQESELRHLAEDLEKRRSRRNLDEKDRYHHDEHSSRHSDRSSRSSDIPSRSSDRSLRSSDRVLRPSDFPSRKSDRYSRLDDLPPKSSDRYSRLGDLPTKSSDRYSRLADLPTKSSDRPSRSSDLPSYLKDRPSRSSDLPSKSSDRIPRLSELLAKSSERTSRLNELPSRLSDRSSRLEDRYSRLPRRRESFDDKYSSRRDDDRRRRSTERYYNSDDDHRRSKRSSSYLPFSSLWR